MGFVRPCKRSGSRSRTSERNFINITLHFIEVNSLWKSKKRLNLNFNLMKKKARNNMLWYRPKDAKKKHHKGYVWLKILLLRCLFEKSFNFKYYNIWFHTWDKENMHVLAIICLFNKYLIQYLLFSIVCKSQLMQKLVKHTRSLQPGS